ncbi:capsular exopolysaccharide synthesis family protein [Runella defluvii]|uniref:non-specific protein-tyrosine kinase n=1 Tax=Runella defluvii TaxID=370973 RepID=A0A7W6ERK3_9BACT|nr:polysaccharide biosynthesis tyrosine autokinase [Runella defluvii]MBB3839597.1 capsular exopolysaccharide synthesis family protein [Runella defluvii]
MENLEFWLEKEEDFNLKLFLLKYLRYWYWFVIAVAVALCGAFFYLQLTTPIYKVTASMLIKDEKKGMGGGNEMLKELDLFNGNKIVENEMEVLKSRSLMEKVIDDLNLSVSYFEEGTYRDSELFQKSPITINYTQLQDVAFEKPLYVKAVDNQHFNLMDDKQHVVGSYIYTQPISSIYGRFRVFLSHPKIAKGTLIKVRFSHKESLISSLIAQIQVELINQKSTVLLLSTETSVPDKGKSILAKLLDAYTFSALEDKNLEASNTLRFIEDRLKLITGELTIVEKDVESYKTSQGITDLSTEANLFLEKVKENDTKLNEVDIQLKVLEGVERYLQSGQGTVAPASLMVTDPILTSFIEKLSELELQKEKMSRSVLPGNPFLETLNTQVANTKQAIRENVNNQKNGLLVTRSSLAGLNKRFESSISRIPRKEREFVTIQRQQNIKENLYLLLLQKREETALSYASTVTDSRIVDKPYSTPGPVKPNNKLIYAIALLVGLVLPAGVINVRELLNDRVQSRKEIETKTGLPVFGEVSLKPKGLKTNTLDSQSRSFINEQFRLLRTNLQYIQSEQPDKGQVLLFTSSTSGEGKSFVTLNLALSIATLGKKVVVLELDMRKPKLTKYLGLNREKGLSNYLAGAADAMEIAQKTDYDNLFLASCGPIPPNPSELLSSRKIGELLSLYREYFDYILLDTPPIGLVTDALVLAPYIDTCFYIVRHEVTVKKDLTILADLKKFNKFKSINVIFNGVNYRNSQEYRYGYGYGYKYGKGYYG